MLTTAEEDYEHLCRLNDSMKQSSRNAQDDLKYTLSQLPLYQILIDRHENLIKAYQMDAMVVQENRENYTDEDVAMLLNDIKIRIHIVSEERDATLFKMRVDTESIPQLIDQIMHTKAMLREDNVMMKNLEFEIAASKRLQ